MTRLIFTVAPFTFPPLSFVRSAFIPTKLPPAVDTQARDICANGVFVVGPT
jgi:hypothetical protein